MNNIESISYIKRENLDEKNYFKTLINEAYNKEILNVDEVNNIQMQLIKLLDEIVYKYNGFECTSIRKEILEEISNSNIYTIEIILKTYKNPDDAINLIKNKGLEEIYFMGRKKIDIMLDIIRFYYTKVKRNMLNIDNITYSETILGGIKGFLKIYDPDFNSRDMKITADYPLFNNLIRKLEGVEFIEEYLKSIYLENKFCKMFSEEKIKYLLATYSQSYKDLIINIFEIVLLEIFGCELIKKNIQDLIISKSELENIYLIFENKSNLEIEKKVRQTFAEIKSTFLKDEINIQKYIDKNFDYIVKLIINSAREKTLDKVFITEKYILN